VWAQIIFFMLKCVYKEKMMKEYRIYFSVKDFLEDSQTRYTTGFDLTQEQIEDHEKDGRYVVGPISTMVVKNAKRLKERKK
jgi:hypothetical protein